MQAGDTSASFGPSAAVSVLRALGAGGLALGLLRLGMGHTPASRHFATLPEFDVWVWSYAAEVGAAAVVAIASFPAFTASGPCRRTTGNS